MGNIASLINKISINIPNIFCCTQNTVVDDDDLSEITFNNLLTKMEEIIKTNITLPKRGLLSLVLLKLLDTYEIEYGRIYIIKKGKKEPVLVSNIYIPEDDHNIQLTKYPIIRLGKMIGFIELSDSSISSILPDKLGNKLNVITDLIEELI